MATPRTNRSRPATSAPAAPIAAWIADGAPWGDTVRYGPGVADEAKLRLLGQLAGKRVLLLGTGCGQVVAQTAAGGAKVIGFEPDEHLLERARAHCSAAGLNLEMYQRDFAELASVRADTVDLVLSVLELAGVADLSRVFRQVHRVLRQEAPIILSLPHPTRAVAAGATLPMGWQDGECHGVDHGHTIEDTFTALVRAGFRVDNLLELPDDSSNPFPAVLVIRARRLGARPGG